jgi:hypothetical protein
MPKRWERELERLNGVDVPTARIRARAADGPTSSGREPERSGRQRVVAGVVAFAVFAAAGVFAWQIFRPVGGQQLGLGPADPPGIVVNFVATARQNGARGTLTSGDQTTHGFIGSHCWTFGGGGGCGDTVAPSFAPGEFVTVGRGAVLTVSGDASRVDGELDRDGPFPFDKVEDFGAISDPIVLDQPAGRYVLSLNAHFDQGDVPFYFPIEIVEAAPSLVMSVDSAPDAAHAPEAIFRFGDATSHVIPQGGSAWVGASDSIGYVIDAPIPVGSGFTVTGNADEVSATIGACCPVDTAGSLDFAEDRTTGLPSAPGEYTLVVTATWPAGRAEYTVYLTLAESTTSATDQRIGVYEAMIRRLAEPQGSKPIYVSAELCPMLSDPPGASCADRISRADQQALIERLADLGTITFRHDGDSYPVILLGPIIEKPDGLRVEGGSVCGGLCGSGAMYIVVPTDTGYEVTGTDDSYGSWIS